MVNHYATAKSAITAGFGPADAVDATCPGGVYDVAEFERLRHFPSQHKGLLPLKRVFVPQILEAD